MAGATSCLTTNAFTLKLVKPCSLIFLVAMAVFSDLRAKAEYHSPNVPLGPMQVSMARAECLIIGGRCDLWVKPEKRVQGVRVSRAKPKTCRFDLWGISDPRMHSLWISRAKSKTRVWCVHVWVYMTGGLGSKVRETIHRGRSQRTNNHVEHQGIVGEA